MEGLVDDGGPTRPWGNQGDGIGMAWTDAYYVCFRVGGMKATKGWRNEEVQMCHGLGLVWSLSLLSSVYLGGCTLE